jgi:hypothetical protein
MATFYSDHVLLNSSGKNVVEPKWLEKGTVAVIVTVPIPSGTTLTANDVLNLCDIPPGVRLTDIVLDADVLDGGGSPALSLDVGVTGSTAQFFSQSTIARAGGVAHATLAGLFSATTAVFSSVTRLFATVHTTANGATSAAGALRARISYTADP